MKSVIVPIGAGLIISIAGYIYQRRASVNEWLQSKRIDNLPERKKDLCGVCGSKMKERTVTSGKLAGKRVMVCTRWPECKKVDWDSAK